MFVNVVVAVGAFHIVELVNAGEVVGGFLLVAAHAFGWTRHDIAGHVLVQRGHFHMTAGAAILTVYRSPEFNRGNNPFMAFEAGFGSDGHAALGASQRWCQQ